MIRLYSLLTAIILAGVCIVAGLCPVKAWSAPGQGVRPAEISFNSFFPPRHFTWPIFRAWAEDIENATNGEVKIIFTAKSVAPPHGVMGAVRHKVVDAGFIYSGFIARRMPGTVLSQMPWLNFGDSAVLSEELWNSYSTNFMENERVDDIKILSMFHLGPTYLCSTTDRPISGLENLKSRRVWALPGPIADTFLGLNLAITAGPAVNLQELVSRNTVDAHQGLTLETMVSFGVAPYTKSCVNIKPSLQSASFTIFINREKWDGLSQEHQAVIENLSGRALALRLGRATNEAEAAAALKLEDMGVQFSPPDAGLLSALEKSARSVRQEWVGKVEKKYGVDGDRILIDLNMAVKSRSQVE